MDAEFPYAHYVAAGLAAHGLFALVWLRARACDNWSVVDVAWAASVPLLAVPAVVAAGGLGVRGVVAAALLSLWGARLAGHLHGRVGGGRDREDPRYAELRERWGAAAPRRMFWFYQIQAVTLWVLMLPLFLTRGDTSPYPAATDIAALALVLLAVAGEAVADAQLARFRAAPENRGKLFTGGLRAYSRHPNYFCEWLVWVGFALAASGAPGGPWAWTAPAVMYLLLRHGSGVPMLEARARRLKGEAWLDYERRTPAFFPRPPRAR